MTCPNCNSDKVFQSGKPFLIKLGIYNSKYICEDCGHIFNREEVKVETRGRKTVLKLKKCKGCNTLFKPRDKTKKFCSRDCYKKYRKTHRVTQVITKKWKPCFCNYCQVVHGKCLAQNTMQRIVFKCDSFEHPTVEEFIEKHKLNPKDTLTKQEIIKVLKGFYFFNEAILIKTATKQRKRALVK